MSSNSKIIGIDFDNTIVCYDDVFYHAALEKKLIPESLPNTKNSVKQWLIQTHGEDTWTELQGFIYGPKMEMAKPFPGVVDCISKLRSYGHSVYIVSHKTQYSVKGEPYDLHKSARAWIRHHGIIPEDEQSTHLFFEPTRVEKVNRIRAIGCSVFIDDLPEVFQEPDFPPNTTKILFDPMKVHDTLPERRSLESWIEVEKSLISRG